VRSEDLLVKVCSPHGVDLMAAAKLAAAKPKSDVISKRGARILVPPAKNRAHGREKEDMLRPSWSAEEVGLAAQDLPELEFRAALFSFAGAHNDNQWFLHRNLVGQGKMFTNIYQWPHEVRDFYGLKYLYLDRLCLLVLMEDQHPAAVRAAPESRAHFLTVTDRVWEQQLSSRYHELQRTWEDWLGLAARRIQAKLSERED
jgi:hypothetical protein